VSLPPATLLAVHLETRGRNHAGAPLAPICLGIAVQASMLFYSAG